MSNTVVSIRVENETHERLERLTKSTKRSRSYLAAEAIREYLDRNEWQIKSIDEAVEKANHGDFISHEATKDWLTSWGSENELPTPTANIKK